jgi:hypothetical protein
MNKHNSLNGKPGPGRPKGHANKITLSIREMIEGALKEAGGQKYLLNLSKSDPKAFCSLVAKILPNSISLGSETGLPAISISFVESNTKRLDDETLNNIKTINDKDDSAL